MNDLRYALRSLRNHPGFTSVAALLIALGIGANCVIFSTLDAVMLKKLAAREPERLFRVVTNLPQLGKRSYMSIAFYQALRERSTLVSDVFGEQDTSSVIREPAPVEEIHLREITPNFFPALGAKALYGRLIGPGDNDAAVLSYRFFDRRFGRDPNALGRTIVLEDRRYSIVGILPKDFNGIAMDTGPDVRVPLKIDKDSSLELSVRLKDGVSAAQAEAEINSIRNAVESKDELAFANHVELEPLEHGISRLRDRFSSALFFLMTACGGLLLIACVNIAGLLLARAAGRRQEISVRLALGATRGRLIRQMLTENLLLAAIGGACGIALAFAAMPFVQRAIPPQRDFSTEIVPLTLDLHPDWRVLAFSLGLCFATAILFGLAPAWSASRAALHEALRSARSSSGWRGRQALMIFQLALCTVLLAAAGLLIRTFERLNHVDTGFDRDHIVTFTVDPSIAGYKDKAAVPVNREWWDRVRALPGVISVAHAQMPVMRGSGMKKTAGPDGARLSQSDFMNTSINIVSPEYFDTMGMRLLSGQMFRDPEPDSKKPLVIVNQTFARRFYPREDPIGKIVGSGRPGTVAKADAQIIGVVSDAKYRSLREPMQPVEYSHRYDEFESRYTLYVRTSNRPESIIGPVREALRSIDPAMPIIEVHTLAEEVSDSLWSERLIALLASAFGALAAILTAVGLYGLIAYAVTQRTREIGIRIALGARPADISRAIGGPAATMVAAGVVAGLGASLMLGPAIRSLLYDVPPKDGLSLSFSTTALVLSAALAILLPLFRALRIDPSLALRQDT